MDSYAAFSLSSIMLSDRKDDMFTPVFKEGRSAGTSGDKELALKNNSFIDLQLHFPAAAKIKWPPVVIIQSQPLCSFDLARSQIIASINWRVTRSCEASGVNQTFASSRFLRPHPLSLPVQ